MPQDAQRTLLQVRLLPFATLLHEFQLLTDLGGDPVSVLLPSWLASPFVNQFISPSYLLSKYCS